MRGISHTGTDEGVERESPRPAEYLLHCAEYQVISTGAINAGTFLTGGHAEKIAMVKDFTTPKCP